MKRSIMIVDDEVQILKSFQRIFYDKDFDIITLGSAKEALAYLEHEEVDLIISDMRMPDIDGLHLLKTVKEKYPSIVRVILSGYADEATMFKTILGNVAKLYLTKPWNNQNLMKSIDRIFEVRTLLDQLKIRNIVISQEDLPSMHTTYFRLNKLIADEAAMTKIAAIIEQDQAVATRVLRIANSAFYGIHTASIAQAIKFIGLNNIKEIVLTCTFFNMLKLPEKLDYYKDVLWTHSNMTSKILTGIYKNVLFKPIPDDALIAGLIHDIGKIMIMQKYPERYLEVLRKIEKNHYGESTRVEKEILGFTHEDIGGLLVEWWDLPMSIVESVMFHHDPLQHAVLNKELVTLVAISDYYAWKTINPNITQGIDEALLEYVGIDKEELENMIKDL